MSSGRQARGTETNKQDVKEEEKGDLGYDHIIIIVTFFASSASLFFLRSATFRKRRVAFNEKVALRHASRTSEVAPLCGTMNFFIEKWSSRLPHGLEVRCGDDIDAKSSSTKLQTCMIITPLAAMLIIDSLLQCSPKAKEY